MSRYKRRFNEHCLLDPENPFESIESCVVFGSKDWSTCKRDAWIYGIVVGWGPAEDGCPSIGAEQEVAKKFGWSAEEVARLRRLHERYKKAKESFVLEEDTYGSPPKTDAARKTRVDRRACRRDAQRRRPSV